MKRIIILAVLCVLMAGPAEAGRLRDFLAQRQQQNEQSPFPANVIATPNIAYGDDAMQKLDVYAPKGAKGAPVIVFVHGGGWSTGDKANDRAVANKMSHWTGMGAVFVSVNYRLLPTDVYAQAQDVAKAIAFVQANAGEWGGDAGRLALSGHSAGAHLVLLVISDQNLRAQIGPWKAVVVLDSAAYDVTKLMSWPHMPLFDDAFGADRVFWHRVSPYDALSDAIPPVLLVCSSQRRESCATAQAYAAKAHELRSSASVMPEDLKHDEINDQLGLDSAYTTGVDAFLKQQGVF